MEKEIDSVYNEMKHKSTDELMVMWGKNDRKKYSDNVFQAIRRVLTERSIELPFQAVTTKHKKNNSIIYIVLFLFTLLIMTIANPSKEEYINYLKESVVQKSNDNALVAGLAATIGEPLIDSTTTVSNYIFFSVYTTRIENSELTTAGLLRNFIFLNNKLENNNESGANILKESNSITNTLKSDISQPAPEYAMENIHPANSEVEVIMRRTVEENEPSTHFTPDPSSTKTVSDGHGQWITAVKGIRYPTADGYGNLIFFWHNTNFIEWDSAYESLSSNIVDSGPGYFVVSYSQYAPGDPLASPSLQDVEITYTWNGKGFSSSGLPPQNTFGGYANPIRVKYIK
ncbi:MAG: DUF4359 domain-containing protein [Desulfitobacterium hafniense]|nr:DUF4359 domain-containing protein [Desulfitobacterium hafniense]